MFAVGALVVAAAGITAYVKIQDLEGSDGSVDPSRLTNPAGGEGGPPLVLGGDSTDSAGGSVDPVGGGSGGQTDPVDPPPQPRSMRLTVDSALNVLFDQEQALDPDGDGEYTANPTVLRAVVDTTEQLWSLMGMSGPDRAMAAYVRGAVAIALGNKQDCLRWLDRAIELENRAAMTLRERCQRMDD
jgi:hypothetical protein